MTQAEDISQKVCSLEDMESGAGWERVQTDFQMAFSICIRLDIDCKQQNLLDTEADIQALIYTNFSVKSVVQNVCRLWSIMAQARGRIVRKDTGGLALTMCNQTMKADRGKNMAEIINFILSQQTNG